MECVISKSTDKVSFSTKAFSVFFNANISEAIRSTKKITNTENFAR